MSRYVIYAPSCNFNDSGGSAGILGRSLNWGWNAVRKGASAVRDLALDAGDAVFRGPVRGMKNARDSFMSSGLNRILVSGLKGAAKYGGLGLAAGTGVSLATPGMRIREGMSRYGKLGAKLGLAQGVLQGIANELSN